jgi:UDP-GlcNAc:undecaprenyl-phosphate GlcNAc-1-phosphate transferase
MFADGGRKASLAMKCSDKKRKSFLTSERGSRFHEDGWDISGGHSAPHVVPLLTVSWAGRAFRESRCMTDGHAMKVLTSTDWREIVFSLAFGCLSCSVLIPVTLRWAGRHGAIQRPREFHHPATNSIVRFGGIPLFAAFLTVAIAIASFHSIPAGGMQTLVIIVAGSMAMFGLGLWDDLRGVNARIKLVAQAIIAVGVYYGGIRIDVLKDPLSGVEYSLGILGPLATVLWLVSLTNLINLIDGIDGLAAGICLMLMGLLANLGLRADAGFSTLLSLGVAGALLGFLRFNYPPARIHMGDGGAYFLGFLIGTLSIVNSNKGTVVAALIAPAFALALPIADVLLAVLRRATRGLPVFRPDQKHIHHQLLKLGFSRERAVLILYTVSSLCLFLAFEVFWQQGRLLPLLSGMLFLILIVAGHVCGFTRDWSSLMIQLGDSWTVRKETRYALTMRRWLEMEAERDRTESELWDDYQFITRKLGFARARILKAGDDHWRAGLDDRVMGMQYVCHEIHDGSLIEFCAEVRILRDPMFKLLADLAAETWDKSISRWRTLNPAPAGSLPAAPISGLSAAKAPGRSTPTPLRAHA